MVSFLKTFAKSKNTRRLRNAMFLFFITVGIIGYSVTKLYLNRYSKFHGSTRFNRQANLVLEHFENSGDSLKLIAARFLLENATYHHHLKTVFVDTLGNEIGINVYDYENRSQIEKTIDSLRNENKYEIHTYPVWDVDLLTADQVIENIELAFLVWRTRPWASHVTFDQFCEFILPYRAFNEPLDEWRSGLKSQYQWISDSLQNINDPIEACRMINTSLASWLKFDWQRGAKELNFQSITELIQNRHGRCGDLVTMAACAMRAQGIPVAIDFVPHWAHRNSGHSWNALLTRDGNTLEFGGAETNPGEYRTMKAFCKAGKIFRHTFARQSESLAAKKELNDEVPSFLNKFNLKDVTKNYVSVGDIQLSELVAPTGTKYVYLCTYSSGSWKPVYWAELVDRKAIFKEMDDNEVLYLPAYFESKKILPAGPPFVFSKDHSIKYFHKNDSLFDIELGFYNKFYDDTLLVGKFQKNIKYSLSYWDGYWKRIGTQTADESLQLFFKDIPSNVLLRVESVALSNVYQRPFFIRNGQQIFL